MRILNYTQLVELHACESHRNKFYEIFGYQAEVSVERFSQPDVVSARFDYYWAADLLMTQESAKAFYQELDKRKAALRDRHGVLWNSETPAEDRRKLEAVTWAEFYVKDGEPKPVAEPVTGESRGSEVSGGI